MSIKKIKVGSIFVNEEKSITSKKDGKVYNLCEANIKVADDSQEYAGQYVKVTFFEYIDKKDSKKNTSATNKANYFKTQNDGKELILKIEEQPYVNKDGEDKIALKGSLLSKKEAEMASQFIK